MANTLLSAGDGERRVDARYELLVWAVVRRACGDHAGEVLVTDLSRGGFNMQSRWDFAPRQEFVIDLPPETGCQAKVAWQDPIMGAYGCRFDQMLSDDSLARILLTAGDDPAVAKPTISWGERRAEGRFEMRVPMVVRRSDVIEREIVVLTNLSASGFCFRSNQSHELRQTVYVELGPNLLVEARVMRHNKMSGEYGGRLSFSLSPVVLERLMASAAAPRRVQTDRMSSQGSRP